MERPDAHSREEQNQGLTVTVTDPRAATLLANFREVLFLMTFMPAQGSTVAQAAQAHQLTPNAAYRKVKRLQELKLLSVIRTDSRAGRAIKIYRSAAQRYFIPQHLVPLEDFMREGFEPSFSQFRVHARHALLDGPNPVTGLLVVGDQAQDLALTYANKNQEAWTGDLPGSPVLLSGFRVLQLDYARARQFRLELQSLLDQYKDEQGNTTYLFGQFLTPTTGHVEH